MGALLLGDRSMTDVRAGILRVRERVAERAPPTIPLPHQTPPDPTTPNPTRPHKYFYEYKTSSPHPTRPDLTPPVTTLSNVKYKNKDKYYEITLTTNEPATSYFRVTGKGTVVGGGTNSNLWQTYTGIVTIKLDKKGTVIFDYYSIDEAENQEATRTKVLKER